MKSEQVQLSKSIPVELFLRCMLNTNNKESPSVIPVQLTVNSPKPLAYVKGEVILTQELGTCNKYYA
jgi:hypothetical protein